MLQYGLHGFRQIVPEKDTYVRVFFPMDDPHFPHYDFYYNDNMVFLKNDYRFDSFLSLLDYYAYIVAGYDEDSYFVKGGNKNGRYSDFSKSYS